MSKLLEAYSTKYRPLEFKDVVGQAAVVSSLQGVIKRKASKTFLLDGPSGTGKTTLARIAAVAVGCKERRDIQEIDAAIYTGVDDMRQITSGLMYRAIGSEVKALIVDECHMLSKAAWNSLLKILEEPPSYVYWFLCTTEPHRVPATVITRCVRYQLKTVSLNDLLDLLDKVADAEDILPGKVGGSIIKLCATEANGSPRQALVNLASCAEAQTREEAEELLSSAHETTEAIDLARALLAGVSWMKARELLNGMKTANPESIRITVRNYISATILSSTNDKVTHRCMAILDAFSVPCMNAEGLTPIILGIGRMLMSD